MSISLIQDKERRRQKQQQKQQKNERNSLEIHMYCVYVARIVYSHII